MDKISMLQRSLNMSKIRSKNTQPERLVRKTLWKLGYRYRTYYHSLPGRPDIFLSKYRTAVFVHGCFWHQHKGCKRNFMPKSNLDYWYQKLKNNVLKFNSHKKELINKNYKVLVIWECEAKKNKTLTSKLENYFTALN